MFKKFLFCFDKINFNSLKSKIIMLVIVAALVPMVITGIYFFFVTYSQENTKVYDKLNQFVQNTNTIIDSRFESINTTYFNFINDTTINRSLLQNQNLKDYSYNDVVIKDTVEKRMISYLNFNYIWNIRLVDSVAFFINTEKYYLIARQSYRMELLDTYLKLYKDHKASGNNFEIIPPTPEKQTMYYIRNFKDLDSGSFSGTLIFSINEEMFTREYNQTLGYDGTQIIIYNDQGIILSHSDKTLLGKKIPSELMDVKKSTKIKEVKVDGEIYLVASKRFEGNNITSLIAIPKKSVYSNMISNIVNYMYIFVLIVILFLLIGVFFSSTIIKHINELINSIEKVQQGDYQTKMRCYKEIELNKLSIIFNNLTSHINHLINVVYAKQLLLKEAEIKYLHAQINPHFLYNILISIGYKAKLSNNEPLYKMISYLSEILHASIYSNADQKTTIEDEMKLVNYYLYLQKERFCDKFHIDISGVNNEILHYYIPKFSIQTLVENAIVHGLENKIGQGKLIINGYIKDNSVFIEIIDDGVGFDTQRINFTEISKSKELKNDHSNIGIINTMKRIQHLYGDDYGISIDSKPDIGTKVVIHIPIDKRVQ